MDPLASAPAVGQEEHGAGVLDLAAAEIRACVVPLPRRAVEPPNVISSQPQIFPPPSPPPVPTSTDDDEQQQQAPAVEPHVEEAAHDTADKASLPTHSLSPSSNFPSPACPSSLPPPPLSSPPVSLKRPSTTHRTSSSLSSGRIAMPTLTNLAELTLHSPSSQIIGTPFAATNSSTRFEYPFPESTSNSSSADPSSAGSSPNSSHISHMGMGMGGGGGGTVPSLHPPPPPGASSAYTVSASSSSSSSMSSQLSNVSPTLSNGSSSDHSSYTTHTPYPPMPMALTHPKLRASATNPPIPPSLLGKKRPRWTLNLLGRRRSSYQAGEGGGGQSSRGGSQDSVMTTASTMSISLGHAAGVQTIESVLGGGVTSSPPGSPMEGPKSIS